MMYKKVLSAVAVAVVNVFVAVGFASYDLSGWTMRAKGTER